MANTGIVNLNPDFVGLWWLDFNVLDCQVFSCLPGDGGLVYQPSVGHQGIMRKLVGAANLAGYGLTYHQLRAFRQSKGGVDTHLSYSIC
jgi:hypothetical protein